MATGYKDEKICLLVNDKNIADEQILALLNDLLLTG